MFCDWLASSGLSICWLQIQVINSVNNSWNRSIAEHMILLVELNGAKVVFPHYLCTIVMNSFNVDAFLIMHYGLNI